MHTNNNRKNVRLCVTSDARPKDNSVAAAAKGSSTARAVLLAEVRFNTNTMIALWILVGGIFHCAGCLKPGKGLVPPFPCFLFKKKVDVVVRCLCSLCGLHNFL
jgi:hypothetical protein